MNIGFICPSSPEPIGGVIVLYEVANALARRGHTIHIAHVSPWGRAVRGIDEVPWFTFHPTIHHHFENPDPSAEPEPVITDVLVGSVPTRIGHDSLPAGLIQGFDMLGPEIETEWFRQPGLKVFVASWLIDAAKHLGTRTEHCVVMSPGIPLETFRVRTAIEDRPPRVAMLGHIHPAKNTRLGLAALEQVHALRPDVQAVLFSAHEIDLPVPSWVEQVRTPDHQTLSHLFNRCSVFLQPSAYEGFGLTSVEAMASGCALVSTDNGGSRDYAFAGRTAVVTDPGDVTALARGTVHLLDDPEERVRLALAGNRFVQRFTWDESARILEEALEAYVADPDRYLTPPGPNLLAGVPAQGNWARTVLRETRDPARLTRW